MKHSVNRILTTHSGSLPRPDDLVVMLRAKDSGQAYDKRRFATCVQEAVADIVRKQAELGIDVFGDGEQSKSNFAKYTRTRLAGFEPTNQPPVPWGETRDSLVFPEVYAELKAMNSARPSKIGPAPSPRGIACTGPIRYIGQEEVRADLDNLKAALRKVSGEEAFVTAISPTNVAAHHENVYYRTTEEYLTALADAMNEEYKAIVEAGFVLQIDDPRLATYYSRHPKISIDECRKEMAALIEVVNYALRGIAQEKVRFHTCYSVNIAPRVAEMELKDYVDLMLRVNAGAYSIEASNPRHEHEWQLWQDVKLPEDKVLIPGVVSHTTTLVEHPELVAQRIVRFAKILGRERVIGGNDCGFATAAAGDQVHPQIAWAKLQSLSEGARLATRQLWG